MMANTRSFLLPMAIVALFFFSIGFALGINSFLMPVLQGKMQMSALDANLLLTATFVPFILFGYPATLCIRAIGYKRTMALSFFLFAIAFCLFIVAAQRVSFGWFLVASFVSGAANAVLQASVNPYITILGPLESAAQRISICGICNKLAWPTTTLFITLVIGKSVGEIEMADLFLPFRIIVGVFVVLCVIALVAPMPEVKAAGEDESDAASAPCPYAEGKTSVFQFPHLLLGVLALFFYVGVETISLATAVDYASSLGLKGDNWGYVPSLGMVLGYIIGAVCIPWLFSQVTAMRCCAVVAVVGSVLVAMVPSGTLSVYCIFLMALGCSLMWPALWPMAMAELGRFTKAGSSLLTMAIAGGALMPLVRGWVQDLTDFQTSYWVCVPCFLYILFYGLVGYRVRR
ncbi:MAG: glucose/galactose MFS transporter [Prevotellaceae bacterium]|nr:glucose/galactose MFS transporter [Prevotellaceae bacterium]